MALLRRLYFHYIILYINIHSYIIAIYFVYKVDIGRRTLRVGILFPKEDASPLHHLFTNLASMQ